MSQSENDLNEFMGAAGTAVTNNDAIPPRNKTEDNGDKHVHLGAACCYEDKDPAFFPAGKTKTKLTPGQYTIKVHRDRGIYFEDTQINLDELLVLPDTNSEKVLASIENFWMMEAKFRQHKFLWKRGIMLWGPPGSGKTSLLQLLSKQLVDRKGLAFYIENPHIASAALKLFRTIEPKRPAIVILEDIDAIVRDYGESHLLALLDGEVQIDNVVYVATTNYPELLDRRLINRPSRFDEVIKIGMPSAAARKLYLEKKNPRLKKDAVELATWVTQTDGFSVAHLRELIVAVECLGNDVDVTIKRLRTMNDIKICSEQGGLFKGFAE